MSEGNDKKLILLKDKALMMSLEEVFEQFTNFLRKSIQSFVGKFEYDDLFQTASYGLMKAYKAYDSSKDIMFITYLARIVNNELLMYNRRFERHLNNLSLNTPFNIDIDGNELMIEDITSDGKDYADVALESMYNDILYESIKELKPQEQTVLKAIYFEELKQDEVAKKYNLSQSYVSRIQRRALNKLHKIYKNGGVKMGIRAKITKEQLLEECRKHGTTGTALTEIGKKYGLDYRSVWANVKNWGIKEKLKELQEQRTSEVSEIEEIKEALPVQAEIAEVVQELTEITQPIEPMEVDKKKHLKTTKLTGTIADYNLTDGGFLIIKGGRSLPMLNKELEDFIQELLELKEYREVG